MKTLKFLSFLFLISLVTPLFASQPKLVQVMPQQDQNDFKTPRIHHRSGLHIEREPRNSVAQRDDHVPSLSDAQLQALCQEFCHAAVQHADELSELTVNLIANENLYQIFSYACQNDRCAQVAFAIIKAIKGKQLSKAFIGTEIGICFSHAVSNGHNSIVQSFLTDIPGMIPADQFGDSLSTAARNNDIAIVKLLLENAHSKKHITNDHMKTAINSTTNQKIKDTIAPYTSQCCVIL